MTGPLENQPWWNDVVSALRSRKLRDIAREHRVAVADLQQALERTGHLKPKAAEEEAPKAAEAPAPKPARGKAPAVAKGKPKAKPAARGKAAPAAAPSEGKGPGRATAKLEALRDQLGKIPDGEIARLADVARKTVVEFRKKHNIERYRGPEAVAPVPAAPKRGPGRPRKVPAEAAPAPVAAAPAADQGASSTGRASKLDSFRDVIGILPDREVADRSGMTTENVRMFRLCRGIPAQWRGEGGAKAKAPARAAAPPAAVAAPAAEAPVVAAPVVAAPAVAAPAVAAPPAAVAEESTTRVDRALAPFLGEIGKVPDADIAARANVSRSAVSAWRQRNGVSASTRSGRPAARAAEAAPAQAAPTRVQAAPAPATAARPAPVAAPAVAPAPVVTGGTVYRVELSDGSDEKVFGVLAADAVDAVARATRAAARLGRGWVVAGLRRVGDALPE